MSYGGVGGVKEAQEGMCVYLSLIHADIWQKQTQYCKTIILQLKHLKKELTMSFRLHTE